MSAFIDDELNEIETHRFEAYSEEKNDIESYGGCWNQKSLITSFLTFMSIRTSMLQQSYSHRISVDEHEALFQRISSAIEKTHRACLSVGISSRRPVIGFAVAASLLLVVSFVALNIGNSESVEVVGGDNVDQLRSSEVEPELRDLDADRQKYLRQYLNERRIMRTKRASQLVTSQ